MKNPSAALLAGVLLLLAACGNGETVLQPPTTGTLTAEIDGLSWQASADVTVEVEGGFASISGSDTQGILLAFDFPLDQGAGSFTVGQAFGPTASLSDGGLVWSATAGAGTGVVSLTTVTDDRLVGSFQFGLVAVTEGTEPPTRTVTQGAFDVTY